LLLNSALNGLQLNGFADEVNILGESIHTIRKNTDAEVVASKEIVLEVLIKLSTWLCLEIRMQDEVTT
jgi:hypothetical protein